MFTGIVAALGRVQSFECKSGDWALQVQSDTLDFSDVRIGDSIAVSGVCLTVVEQGADWFRVDVSNETVSCTAMTDLHAGDNVNLEKALTPDSRLGGHIVSGHVDGLAELLSRQSDGRSERLRYRVPDSLSRYIAHKGSVCLDGVSLTVNEVKNNEFGVNIIPHTSAMTTMQYYRVGQKVNLEVDVISRYLERLLMGEAGSLERKGIDLEFLAKNGFASH
ncbi:MAG: riboflavin synthase [Pseudohongiellaceae bacterium]